MLGIGECGGLDLLWWPPLYGVLAATLDVLVPTGAALILAALIPMALLGLPLVALAGRLGGTAGAALGGVTVASMPLVHMQAMTGDGRALGLTLAAGAWVLATGGGAPRRAIAAGVLAGLAVLARTEALAVLTLVPFVVALRWNSIRTAACTALAAFMVAGPWWAALSVDAGALRIRPRTVESWAVPLLEVLPRSEVIRLIGASAGGTPFRTAAEGAGAAAGTAALDIAGGLQWLAAHGPEAATGLLWVLPVCLAVVLRRRHAWTLLAITGLAVPALGAALVPQGRDALAPMSNLLPFTASIAVLSGGAAGAAIGNWLSRNRHIPAGIGLAAILAVLSGLRSGSQDPPLPGVETTAPGRAAVAALRAAPEGTVQATFESAALVHLAERPWTPWPDPWLPREQTASIAVVTDLDPDWRAALRDPAWDLHHLGGDDRGWAAVLVRRGGTVPP